MRSILTPVVSARFELVELQVSDLVGVEGKKKTKTHISDIRNQSQVV